MNNDNQKITLNTYEKNAHKYITETPDTVTDFQKELLDKIISLIPKESNILEVGSAVGRDADYLEENGYKIFRTDIVKSFIHHQNNKSKKVELFNIINGDLGIKFDVVLAFAVFLHFNNDQFIKALLNVKNHLNKRGLLALSVKQGEGEEYSSHKMDAARYFKYWNPEELQKILEYNGFGVEYLKTTAKGKWIHCIARLK